MLEGARRISRKAILTTSAGLFVVGGSVGGRVIDSSLGLEASIGGVAFAGTVGYESAHREMAKKQKIGTVFIGVNEAGVGLSIGKSPTVPDAGAGVVFEHKSGADLKIEPPQIKTS